MQPRELVLIQLADPLCVPLDALAEPLVELLVAVKKSGHDEMEEGPQLCHVVLDGSACRNADNQT